MMAQAVGIQKGKTTLTCNEHLKLEWERVDFDTAGPSGIIVLYTGTDRPSGNIYLRQPGIWRIGGQVYAMPPPVTGVSLYVGIYDLGPDGADYVGPLYSANQFLPIGNHPSLPFEYEVKVERPRYYCVEAYYLSYYGTPPTHQLAIGDNYNSVRVECME